MKPRQDRCRPRRSDPSSTADRGRPLALPRWKSAGDERCRPEQQGVTEYLALHGVDAVAVAVGEVGRSPHSEEGRGRTSEQHPAREAGPHRSQPTVPDAAERLEDRPVEDVRADRHRRVEVEEEDQNRRHGGAAPHPGHPDEEPGDQTGEDEEWIVQASR